jgi:hypothetical protein
MKRFWQALDGWLFSPPHRFDAVLRMTDLLLQASDPSYAVHRRLKAPLEAVPLPPAVESELTPPPAPSTGTPQ